MGICGSALTEEEKKAIEASKNIEHDNMNEWNNEQDKIKLLLLGPGESGKSTIFKQMRIIYGQDFSEEDREYYKRHVYSNTVEAMRDLCVAVDSLFDTRDRVQAQDDFAAFMGEDITTSSEIDDRIGNMIKRLWADPVIQEAWSHRSEFQVVESAGTFFNDIDRIMAFEYLPSPADILLTRVRTSGIVEDKYNIDGTDFVMFDVGGQRNERKKWIHCFDDVSAVIFVAALSEFDQVLFEDDNTNRMEEAVHLFQEICNSRWFTSTSMILFLNKRDLFEEKIQNTRIKDISQFSQYTGEDFSYEDGIEFFLTLFLQQNKSKTKDIYHHITCATDSSNIAVVFNACKEIILKNNLEENGFVN